MSRNWNFLRRQVSRICVLLTFYYQNRLNLGPMGNRSLWLLYKAETLDIWISRITKNTLYLLGIWMKKKKKERNWFPLNFMIVKRWHMNFKFKCIHLKGVWTFYLFILNFIFLTLQYCIGFSIYQHESATGIHVFLWTRVTQVPSWTLLPPPSPYHPSGSSQCTSPKNPVSCIEPGLATHFIYDIIHVSMPLSQIIPHSPSPTESKRLFYTSVSLLLFHIQGYRYHLSKFHVYVLVYCIGVFLSVLLHSV